MTKNLLKKAAAEYSKRGIPVFPINEPSPSGKGCSCKQGNNCKSPGKHPRTKNGFKDATTDRDQIDRWWDASPDANIGIPTGTDSGWLVLDVDPRHGGLDSLEELFGSELPDTLVVETGSGGFHFIFQHPEGANLRGRVNLLAGLDIRAEGNYVVVPPSRHVSGGSYQYLNEKPVIPPPDCLLELLEQQPQRPNPKPEPATTKVREGYRNDVLFRRGCSMRAKGASREEITSELLSDNSILCEPPLDDAEVGAIAESASRYEPSVPDIDQLLAESGVTALTKRSSRQEIRSALTDLSRPFLQLGALNQGLLREEVISILRDSGAQAPAKLFDAAMTLAAEGETSTDTIIFEQREPWADPVNGQNLFEELKDILLRFLYLPDGSEVVLALWVIHTYALEAFSLTPYLVLSSPEKGCGKTTAIELLCCVANKPIVASNITAAAVFRTIDKYCPTLLIDEADTFFNLNPELRGVVNSGNRRHSAYVIRTVGENHEPKQFSTWCAKVIALIGNLPDTIADRSISIPMQRKPPSEQLEDFDAGAVFTALHPLRRQIDRWVLDHLDEIREADPNCPSQLTNRTRDKWTIPLKIAQVLGDDVLERARSIAVTTAAASQDQDDSIRVQLLLDIQSVFAVEQVDKISSTELAGNLCKLEDRPWPEYKNGKEISTTQIALLLKPFGIRPKQTWFENTSRNQRGYRIEDFEEVFEAYLPPDR